MRTWIFLAFLTACPSSKEETGDTSSTDTADTGTPEAFAPNAGTWHVNGVVVNTDTCEIDDGTVGKKPEGTLTLTDNGKGTYGLNPYEGVLDDFACTLDEYTLSCDDHVIEEDHSDDGDGVDALTTLTYSLGLVFTDASVATATWGLTYACDGAACDRLADALPNPCDYAAEGEATHVPNADVGPPPAFSD